MVRRRIGQEPFGVIAERGRRSCPDRPALKWNHSSEVKLIYFKRRAQLFPRPFPPSRGHAWTRVALGPVDNQGIHIFLEQ